MRAATPIAGFRAARARARGAGAACAHLLPDTSSPFPVNGCSSGCESGWSRLPGWAVGRAMERRGARRDVHCWLSAARARARGAGAACAHLLPDTSSPFPVKGCSSGRELGRVAAAGLGSGWGNRSAGGAPRRPPLAPCCASARARRGAACIDLLPDTSSPFPVKSCSSGRELGRVAAARQAWLGSG